MQDVIVYCLKQLMYLCNLIVQLQFSLEVRLVLPEMPRDFSNALQFGQ